MESLVRDIPPILDPCSKASCGVNLGPCQASVQHSAEYWDGSCPSDVQKQSRASPTSSGMLPAARLGVGLHGRPAGTLYDEMHLITLGRLKLSGSD